MPDALASRVVRIAVAQYAPRIGEAEYNRALAVRWATDAAQDGAQLIVLPELAGSGYAFATLDEARSLAEEPQDGETIGRLIEVARRHGAYIVAGLAERADDCLHDSAVLVGPEGVLAVYRKLHLFYREQSWFTPGFALEAVDLPFGRVGMLICYDLWFPEAVRALALAGCDIVAVPTNWVGSFKPTTYDERGYCQGDYVAMAASAQNGVVMACADRIGIERDHHFLGASLIVGADGWPIAGPASKDAQELLVADVELSSIERARARTPRNHLLTDRRPESYQVTVARSAGRPRP